HHFRRFTPGLLLGSYFFVKGVLSPALLLEKCAYIVTTLGGVTLCPLALLALCRRKWVLFGLLLSTSALLSPGISGYGPAEQILLRRLERGRGWPGARWIAYANPTLAGALALCLAAADREFAEMYRSFGSTLERAYPNRAGRLWFTGEWGFRAYLERMGGEELG